MHSSGSPQQHYDNSSENDRHTNFNNSFHKSNNKFQRNGSGATSIPFGRNNDRHTSFSSRGGFSHNSRNDRKPRNNDLFSRIGPQNDTFTKNYNRRDSFSGRNNRRRFSNNSNHSGHKNRNPLDGLKVYDDEHTEDTHEDVDTNKHNNNIQQYDEGDYDMEDDQSNEKDSRYDSEDQSSSTLRNGGNNHRKSHKRKVEYRRRGRSRSNSRSVSPSARSRSISGSPLPPPSSHSLRQEETKPHANEHKSNSRHRSSQHDRHSSPQRSRSPLPPQPDLQNGDNSSSDYEDRRSHTRSRSPKRLEESRQKNRYNKREKYYERGRSNERSWEKDKKRHGRKRYQDTHEPYGDNDHQQQIEPEIKEVQSTHLSTGDLVLPTGPSSWRDKQDKRFNDNRGGRGRDDKRFDNRSAEPNGRNGQYLARGRSTGQVIQPALKTIESSYLSFQPSSVFRRTCQVGEGTYGKVYKAVNLNTNNMVALKRLRLETERDGVPITAVREIKLLQNLRHKNIVQLQEMMIEQNQFYMVFEYADHDLAGLLSIPDLKLSVGNIKYMFRQAVEGLAFIHHRGVLHRDIKGSNILVTGAGHVKLADFGLARSINTFTRPEDAMYTNRVITLWYRPPELLLGATHYDGSVDVWGMGCLLMEFFTRSAIFQGNEEVAQLLNIYKTMGTPDKCGWTQAESLPWYNMLAPTRPLSSRFDEAYEACAPPIVLQLAKEMLSMNPTNRPTAKEVLKKPFFRTGPPEEAPTQIEDLKGEWHDFEAKKRKKKAKEVLRKEREKENSEASSDKAPDSKATSNPNNI